MLSGTKFRPRQRSDMALNTRTAPDGTPYTEILTKALLPLNTLAVAKTELERQATDNGSRHLPLRLLGRDP